MTKLRGKEAKARLIWLRVKHLRCDLHAGVDPAWCRACTDAKRAALASLWKLTTKQIKEVKL